MEIKHYNWSDEHVLIADDDHYSFLLLQKMLKRTGANVLFAYDGKEAIDVCCNNKSVTMAIIDIRMPFYDGFEVVKEIRKCRDDIVFIAQTADVMSLVKNEKEITLFHKVFQKPYLPVKFLEEVDKILYTKRRIKEPTNNQ